MYGPTAVHFGNERVEVQMAVVGVRDLGKRASAIVDDVATTREGTVITKRGRPVAVLMPIDAERFEDYVLATAPDFVSATKDAEVAFRDGRTVSLADVVAELD
jgi:prevent-host-death family protein